LSERLRIAFIGAGNANFGGGEGPWDHAGRLEKIDGAGFPRGVPLSVVGIADVNMDLAQRRLAARRAGAAPKIWSNTEVFADFRQMLDKARPDAVFIGLPGEAHGLPDPPKDAELACAAAGVHFLVEKPLSAYPPSEVAPVARALAAAGKKGLIVSVGYMFRYSLAVEKMRQVLAQTAGGPRAVIARYGCAYSEIASKVWWDSRRTGGVIVEQATHFCDLMRFLAGEVELPSISAVRIAAAEQAGQLTGVPAGRDGRPIDADIPAEQQIPRATAAVWKFQNGAVGSLTHGVLLHGKKYQSQLEVWSDGLAMLLDDPYGHCQLHLRLPGGDRTETLTFTDDDPYLTEDQAFIDAIRTGDASGTHSTYADAMKTYQLTWAIRRASEPR